MNRMNGLMIIRLPRRPRFAAHNYGAALQMLADNGYSKSKGQSAVCELLHNCGKLPPAFERQTRISEATLTLIVLLRNCQTQFYFAFLIVTPPPPQQALLTDPCSCCETSSAIASSQTALRFPRFRFCLVHTFGHTHTHTKFLHKAADSFTCAPAPHSPASLRTAPSPKIFPQQPRLSKQARADWQAPAR